jgi:hypothetical protein
VEADYRNDHQLLWYGDWTIPLDAIEARMNEGEFQDKRRDWSVAAARRVFRTVDAAFVVIDAVRRAEMDAEQAALDDLLK